MKLAILCAIFFAAQSAICGECEMNLLAEHYHQIFTYPDAGFIKNLLSRTGGVLVDFGCATGRILEIAASSGTQAIGIDDSADMIQQGQKRIHDPNIQFVQGRYEDLRTELVGRAGLVTIAANTYMMMLNKADRLRTLAVAKKYLTTNGRIYIDIRNGGASSVFERERQLDLPDGQHLKFHIKWKETPGLRIYELTFTKGIQKQRFTFPTATMSFEAARAEFNEAGLEVEDSFGDYDHSPVTDQSVNWFFVLKLATR